MPTLLHSMSSLLKPSIFGAFIHGIRQGKQLSICMAVLQLLALYFTIVEIVFFKIELAFKSSFFSFTQRKLLLLYASVITH